MITVFIIYIHYNIQLYFVFFSGIYCIITLSKYSSCGTFGESGLSSSTNQ